MFAVPKVIRGEHEAEAAIHATDGAFLNGRLLIVQMAQSNGQQYAQLGYSQGTAQCQYGVGNKEYQSYGLVHSGLCCSTSTILPTSTNSGQMGFSDPGSHFHSPRSSSHKRSESSGSRDQLLDRDERRSRRLHKAHKKKLKSRSSYSSTPGVPEAAGVSR